MTDKQALNVIEEILHKQPWDVDAAVLIAETVRMTGRQVDDIEAPAPSGYGVAVS